MSETAIQLVVTLNAQDRGVASQFLARLAEMILERRDSEWLTLCDSGRGTADLEVISSRSKEPPTKAGFYWCNDPLHGWMIVRVFDTEIGLFANPVDLPSPSSSLADLPSMEWAAIPMPDRQVGR